MITDYELRKSSGDINEIKYSSGMITANIKRFSTVTGEELNPEIIKFGIGTLDHRKAELEKQLVDIQVLIADCNNLIPKSINETLIPK